MKSTLQEIKEHVQDMKPVTANTAQILNIVATADYQIRDLAKFIKMDISLSTQCLRIVNSSAYSLCSPITSVERAVSYLGRKTILDLVIKLGLSGVYSSPMEGYEGEQGALWEHSLRTALASRLVAQSTSQEKTADVAYTAGLLHDVGKIVINHFLDKQPSDIIKEFAVGEKNDFNTIESQLLDTDHAEVGHMMAVHWGFPDILQKVIR